MQAVTPTDPAALLRALDDSEDVQVPERMDAWLPALAAAGPALWREAFASHTTRFNKYLFLNAPPLWQAMDAADWLALMRDGVPRVQRPQDVFDSGRLDDLRLLHRYVGVDALQMFFDWARPSDEDRRRVQGQLARQPDLLLPDDADDALFGDDEVRSRRADLAAYRARLQRQLPGLREAAPDRGVLLQRLARLGGGAP